MPIRNAWLYVGLVLAATMVAFWPSLTNPPKASFAFHLHGVTAALWLVMLIAQSWTVHHGGMAAHRLVGRASLLLFPLFVGGGVAMSIGMAQHYASAVAPFYTIFAPRLAASDLVSVLGVGWLYFQALKWRRKVHLHSRYMLATPVFLFGPIFGRILSRYGPLAITSDAEIYLYGDIIRCIMGATIVGLLLLCRAERKHGRPYAEAAALVALQFVLIELMARWQPWNVIYARFAAAPLVPLTLIGCAGGAAVAYAGWVAGRRASPTVSPSAEPALVV